MPPNPALRRTGAVRLKREVRVLRWMLGVVLLSCLWLSPARPAPAEEKPAGLETRLEPFRGRWTTSRETMEDGKVRRDQLVLEFKGGELTFFTEEEGKKGNAFTLTVIAVEDDAAPHLILGHGERSKYAVHYDFV